MRSGTEKPCPARPQTVRACKNSGPSKRSQPSAPDFLKPGPISRKSRRIRPPLIEKFHREIPLTPNASLVSIASETSGRISRRTDTLARNKKHCWAETYENLLTIDAAPRWQCLCPGCDAFDHSLVADPEKHDGKIVRFEGVTNIEFEGNGIYLSKEHWKARMNSFAIWLALDNGTTRGKRWLNGKYCIVEGAFHAADRGHMGLFMRTLSDITVFHQREPISPDEIKRLKRQAGQDG